MTENGKKTMKTMVLGLLVDDSGSMAHKWDDTIKSVNSYLRKVEKDEPDNVQTWVALASFGKPEDGHFNLIHDGLGLGSVPKLNKHNYRPAGFTPLNDATAAMIVKIEEFAARFRMLGEDPPPVLCVIMTDGLENASKEHTADDIRELITARQGEGNWTFVFLGADADEWDKTAREYGIPRGNQILWKGSSAGAAMGAARQATQVYSASVASGSSAGSTNDFWKDANVLQVTEDHKKALEEDDDDDDDSDATKPGKN